MTTVDPDVLGPITFGGDLPYPIPYLLYAYMPKSAPAAAIDNAKSLMDYILNDGLDMLPLFQYTQAPVKVRSRLAPARSPIISSYFITLRGRC